ncbi:MAG: phosphomethylpyrimidine synthase ThiC [Deltaproteobacteria bacterium]|nr:phosphomethylpyrimidine synthase ThiC [Deltaproteobacteria bacterium]
MGAQGAGRPRGEAVTQLHRARKGETTAQMRRVAERERLDPDMVRDEVAKGRLVIPANVHHRSLDAQAIGDAVTCKINTNIGGSTVHSDAQEELCKLRLALSLGSDAVMDLTTGPHIGAIRAALLDACPAPLGTVPIYEAMERVERVEDLTADGLLGCIEEQALQGVDFVTVHAGLLAQHVPLAMKRLAGIVSRGGALLAAWMAHHGRENPLYENFDRLLDICRAHDLTLSLGDGLRPGCLADASDEAQLAELKTLGALVERCHEAEVQVMVEGPGHVPFDEIAMNMRLEREWCREAPFYVLGPVVTDIAPGYDHITAAIGATMAAFSGAAMLCYVTPREHLGLPDLEDVRQGVIAFKIAAHAADVARKRPGARERDDALSRARVAFDWDRVFELSLDPHRARAMYEAARVESSVPGSDYCSMCGPKFCAMKVSKAVKAIVPGTRD